jgi:hypothetical protein
MSAPSARAEERMPCLHQLGLMLADNTQIVSRKANVAGQHYGIQLPLGRFIKGGNVVGAVAWSLAG